MRQADSADLGSSFSFIVCVSWDSRSGSQPSRDGVRNHLQHRLYRYRQLRLSPTLWPRLIVLRTLLPVAQCRRQFNPESDALPRPYATPCLGSVTWASVARRRTQ